MIKLLVFSIIIILIYYMIPHKFRRHFLLFSSAVFYIMIDWKMLALLAAEIIWVWKYGQILQSVHEKKKNRIVVALLPVIIILVFFKMNRFFVAEVGDALNRFGIGTTVHMLALIMPLGLSYYTFKAISYLVDVYNGKYEGGDFINVALYISFFPEIQSGPISRFDSFIHSLSNGMNFNTTALVQGFYLILKGLFMKTVIANRLSGYTDAVFSNPMSYTGLALWFSAFFYAIQLYCDFAGYSSIVIGITRILGMHTQKNFKRPYFAASIQEFWNRWHISLSTWLRDYIYIPLGGSRKGNIKTKINLLIVFLVSGLWHGDGLQFVIWGGYHGILRCLSRNKRIEKRRALHILLTFVFVTFGWIIFRSDSIGLAFCYIARMFTGLQISFGAIQEAILPFTNDNTCVAFFLTVMSFILVLFIREVYEEKKGIETDHVASVPWMVFLLASVILFGNLRVSSFIYANF